MSDKNLIDDKKWIPNPEDSYSVIFRELFRIAIITSLDNSDRKSLVRTFLQSTIHIDEIGRRRRRLFEMHSSRTDSFGISLRNREKISLDKYTNFSEIYRFDGFPRNMISCDRGTPRGDECTKSRPGIRSRGALRGRLEDEPRVASRSVGHYSPT